MTLSLFFEIVEVVRIGKALQESINILKMSRLSCIVLHTTTHNIAGSLIRVEIPA
jgi:hypothetical protein